MLTKIQLWLKIVRNFFFSPWLYRPWRTLAASHIGGFVSYLDKWQDSLDEWSARRKASTYTGQHNTERRGQTSMPWAAFEPTIPATNRPRPTPQTARPLWPTVRNMAMYNTFRYFWKLTENNDWSVVTNGGTVVFFFKQEQPSLILPQNRKFFLW
jgi:hypothetical protein